MSIPNYQPRSDYIGTGLVSSYTFDFKVNNASQIKVVKTDDTNVLVWEVSGDDLNYISSVDINDDYGGQVNLIDPLETDYNLYIILDANEPTQTKNFKARKYWSLEQFEAAFDAVVLQLQAVAYLAKRTPILGKMVPQSQADAFNFDIELEPEGVIAVNAAGDGFEAVPRIAFVGPQGPQGDPGPTGAAGSNGANGAGILRAGIESISAGVDTHTVSFSSPTVDTSYVVSLPGISNSVDAYPIFLQCIVTNKTVNGFTVIFNTFTDSANYKLEYQVNDAI